MSSTITSSWKCSPEASRNWGSYRHIYARLYWSMCMVCCCNCNCHILVTSYALFWLKIISWALLTVDYTYVYDAFIHSITSLWSLTFNTCYMAVSNITNISEIVCTKVQLLPLTIKLCYQYRFMPLPWTHNTPTYLQVYTIYILDMNKQLMMWALLNALENTPCSCMHMCMNCVRIEASAWGHSIGKCMKLKPWHYCTQQLFNKYGTWFVISFIIQHKQVADLHSRSFPVAKASMWQVYTCWGKVTLHVGGGEGTLNRQYIHVYKHWLIPSLACTEVVFPASQYNLICTAAIPSRMTVSADWVSNWCFS